MIEKRVRTKCVPLYNIALPKRASNRAPKLYSTNSNPIYTITKSLSIPRPPTISRRRWRRRIPSPTTATTVRLVKPPLARMLLVILRHLRRRMASRALILIPALPSTGRCLRLRLIDPSPPTTRPGNTPQNSEQEQPTDRGADANDNGFVVVDPGFHFAAEGGAFTLALHIVSNSSKRWRGWRLTLLQAPPPPHSVPSRKFCCRP